MKSSFVIPLAVCLFVRFWDCASATKYIRKLHKLCSKNLSLETDDVVELYINTKRLPDVGVCTLRINIGNFRRKFTVYYVSVETKQDNNDGNCYPIFKLQYQDVCLKPSLIGLKRQSIVNHSYSVSVTKTGSPGYIKALLRISLEPVVTFTTTRTLAEKESGWDVGSVMGGIVGVLVLFVAIFICKKLWHNRPVPQRVVAMHLQHATTEDMLSSERLDVVINPSPNIPQYPIQHPTQQPSQYPGHQPYYPTQYTEPPGPQYPSRDNVSHVPAYPPSGSSSEPVDQSVFGPPPSYESCIELERQPLKPSAPPPQEF